MHLIFAHQASESGLRWHLSKHMAVLAAVEECASAGTRSLRTCACLQICQHCGCMSTVFDQARTVCEVCAWTPGRTLSSVEALGNSMLPAICLLAPYDAHSELGNRTVRHTLCWEARIRSKCRYNAGSFALQGDCVRTDQARSRSCARCHAHDGTRVYVCTTTSTAQSLTQVQSI